MRRQTYYVVAALLVLATIPMYRYIFLRARELDHSGSASASPQLPVASLGRLPGGSRRSRTPLLAGEVCKDGRVLLADGSGYSVARDALGADVRCEGRYLLKANNLSTQIDVVRRDVGQEKSWYAYGEKLPSGYKCSAADGPVYRTHIENGATVVEPLMRDGVIVRCGGDERSSHR